MVRQGKGDLARRYLVSAICESTAGFDVGVFLSPEWQDERGIVSGWAVAIAGVVGSLSLWAHPLSARWPERARSVESATGVMTRDERDG